MIRLEDARKAYKTPAGDFLALKGIDLQVQEGEFLAVVGKSGAGKSTLVNMITGIDRPSAGEIRVGAQAIQDMNEDQIATWRGKHVGVVFQFFQLLPMLTCAENVMMPMDFAGLYGGPSTASASGHCICWSRWASPSTQTRGALGCLRRPAPTSSDRPGPGQPHPMLLAADEPTGNLDSKTADAMFQVFERLVA